MIKLYVKLVQLGERTIDKVPVKYREDVRAILNETNLEGE